MSAKCLDVAARYLDAGHDWHVPWSGAISRPSCDGECHVQNVRQGVSSWLSLSEALRLQPSGGTIVRARTSILIDIVIRPTLFFMEELTMPFMPRLGGEQLYSWLLAKPSRKI